MHSHHVVTAIDQFQQLSVAQQLQRLTYLDFCLQTAALTFDDAPDAEGNTDKVLDALKAAGVKATFYVNGNNYCDASAPPCSTTIARITAEGHTIASHTLSHPHTDSLTDAQINTEFSALESVVGQSMTVCFCLLCLFWFWCIVLLHLLPHDF